MRLPAEACCPAHRAPLTSTDDGDGKQAIRGSCGCVFPVIRGIPRFVPGSDYADAFGIQWNAFRKTQLDSHTGTTISRDRLTRCLGGSLDPLRDARVLEVGCGAGRFTELLLDAGAHVFACDLSSAVDANYANCGGHPRYFVCQADVMALPTRAAAFDFVIALGMIQHTPSPEATIRALGNAARPGGLLVIDHYRTFGPLMRWLYPLTPRAILRLILLRLPTTVAFQATSALVSALLPVHRLLWRRGWAPGAVRAVWRRVSPVWDYYDSFPELGEDLAEWARLDTHDGLTDRYKHLRTPAQIAEALRAGGLEVLEARAGGNGVEARARRPRV
jgi:SAM-dependent methyltransferase